MNPVRHSGRAPQFTARGTVAFELVAGGALVLCEATPALLEVFGARGRGAVALVRAFEDGRDELVDLAARRIAQQGLPAQVLVFDAADVA